MEMSIESKISAAEERLLEEKNKMEAILENIGDVVSMQSPDMKIVYQNRSHVEMMGDHLGDYCYKAFACLDTPCADCPMMLTIKDHRAHKLEKVFQTRKGEVLLEINSSPLNDLHGSLIAVIHVSRDITERINAEAEKTRLMSELRRSNVELQEFAYIASHDLQAPVRRIVSFCQLLENSIRGRLTGDDLENFNFIMNSADHMQHLINDLLAYSRVSTNAREFEPVDIEDVVRDVLRISLGGRLEETGGKVLVEGQFLKVLADHRQLLQLFQNVIDNGLKYHREGVSPVIRIKSDAAESGMARIAIEDNGIGIDPVYYPKLFKMFQRLPQTSGLEGSGIGLAICKRIVARHGGDIGINPNEGNGCTFWFTLPVFAEQGAEVESQAAAA